MFTLLFAENGLALRIEGFQLIFEPARLDELVVPSALQFTRNETIVRIHGIVLPPCVRRLKALLLQRQFDLSMFFPPPLTFAARSRRAQPPRRTAS